VGKTENNKKNKNMNMDVLEDQVVDIIKKMDLSDLDNLDISEELRNKLESADENELKKIEEELGLDHNKIIIEEYSSENDKQKGIYNQPVEQYIDEEEQDLESEEAPLVESVDGKCEINITEDKMTAIINLYPSRGEGKPLTMDRLKEALNSSGVVYGINNDLLEKLLKNVEERKEEKRGVIIAQGTLPEQGKEGCIEYHFSDTDEVLREEQENNSMG